MQWTGPLIASLFLVNTAILIIMLAFLRKLYKSRWGFAKDEMARLAQKSLEWQAESLNLHADLEAARTKLSRHEDALAALEAENKSLRKNDTFETAGGVAFKRTANGTVGSELYCPVCRSDLTMLAGRFACCDQCGYLARPIHDEDTLRKKLRQ